MRLAVFGAALLLACGAGPAGAEAQAQVIPITNPALIADADARQRLKYLASCALETGVTLVGTQGGTTYEFPGSMGLAPHWAERALTRRERRWVSACILARTNAFGTAVLISMRADPAPVDSLAVDPRERSSHTIYEGGFFGDIFSDPPQAFVCLPEDHEATASARERRKRVCAIPQDEAGTVSRCDFILVAPCDSEHLPVIGGEAWPEVIHVWLAGAEPD